MRDHFELPVDDNLWIRLDQLPRCPQCGQSMDPKYGRISRSDAEEMFAYATSECRCGKTLIATYRVDADQHRWMNRPMGTLISGPPAHYFEPKVFELSIHNVSKSFCAIYNEAKHAEDSD